MTSTPTYLTKLRVLISEKGLTKDWGSFVSEGSGYAVVEGSEVDINKMVEQYAPYVGFKSHAVATLEQAEELIKSMTG